MGTRDLTYLPVGATRGPMPAGFWHLERRACIGHGRETFERAADGIATWELHRRAGLHVDPSTPRAAEGLDVTLYLGWRPLALRIPCRVVYVVEEPDRAGFAYGTLPGHPECGEELFEVGYRSDGSVHLTVRAFSRPALWWTKAAGPLARQAQRFATQRYVQAFGPPH